MLSQRMADELMNMGLDEAMPLARALGHYLNLTSIAELHHRYNHGGVGGQQYSSSTAVAGIASPASQCCITELYHLTAAAAAATAAVAVVEMHHVGATKVVWSGQGRTGL